MINIYIYIYIHIFIIILYLIYYIYILYIFIYIYMYICICMYINILCIYIYLSFYLSIHLSIYLSISIYSYIYIYIYIYRYIYRHIYSYSLRSWNNAHKLCNLARQVFSILASTERIKNLNHFQPFLMFQWSLSYSFFRHNRKTGKESYLKVFLVFTLTVTSFATTGHSFEFFFWSVNYANLVYNLFITFWKCQDTQTLFVLEGI